MTRVSATETVMIVADPPWPHANGSRTNSGKSPKYPLMNLRELAALAPFVQRLAGDHAVLYVWATVPHLPGALETVAAWGFRYRSLNVWEKSRVACGFWNRSNAEPLLVAERGRPAAPRADLLMNTVFRGAPGGRGHSSKPDVIHEYVERQWPESRKFELFARATREGWTCLGADLGTQITSDLVV